MTVCNNTSRLPFAAMLIAVFTCSVSRVSAQAVQQASPAITGMSPALHEPPRPGDVVRLRVWREPEMSGDFLVEETGRVVLPRIGPIDVSRDTPESLRERITNEFSQWIPHTSISVTLLRRVQILGAVRTPGLYPVDPTMSVSDALALAGGTTVLGKATVQLLRGGVVIGAKLSADTPLGNSAVRSGDQIYVPERSWISRNAVVVSGGITAVVSAMIALLR